MLISPLRMTLVVLGTAVVASVAGAVAGRVTALHQIRTAALFFASASYLVDGANAVTDVHALRASRAGDAAKGASILEAQIDQSLLHLADYETVVPRDERDEVFYHYVAEIRDYRTEVPSSNSLPEVQATIRRTLNLRARGKQR
jgi:hypothetical protein